MTFKNKKLSGICHFGEPEKHQIPFGSYHYLLIFLGIYHNLKHFKNLTLIKKLKKLI